jgi:CheY-like chemotaxis protein
MSHELRTPMNAILGFGQLLAMDARSQDQKESVEHILKAGRHLLGLINEVLEISRIEAGRLRLSLEPVPVGETLRAAVDLVRPLATERGVALETGAPDGQQHVLADRQRLQQVLLNLLSNAVKYNRAGGSVVVSCATAPGDRLQIRVTDTGPGIAADSLPRLFVPFERLGAEASGMEGTGLGLALTRHLVEAMGATIAVESQVGVGTTFSIWLPLAATPALAPAAAAGERQVAAPGLQRPQRVLYIEDNLSNLRLVERIMERRPNVKLLSAMQGRVGLDLAREHQPDLILLDQHLPDVQGDEVLRALRGDPRTRAIPVVILSADASAGQIRRLLEAGARAYLTKPLDVSRLLAVLDETVPPGE